MRNGRFPLNFRKGKHMNLPWRQRLWLRLCGYLRRQVEVVTPVVLEEAEDLDEPEAQPFGNS